MKNDNVHFELVLSGYLTSTGGKFENFQFWPSFLVQFRPIFDDLNIWRWYVIRRPLPPQVIVSRYPYVIIGHVYDLARLLDCFRYILIRRSPISSWVFVTAAAHNVSACCGKENRRTNRKRRINKEQRRKKVDNRSIRTRKNGGSRLTGELNWTVR